MKKLLLLVNPHSGKTDIRADLLDVIDIFVKAGYEVTALTSQQPLDFARIIRKQGSEYDLIVACGGDGTLNEAVNGMMALEDRPPLGYIPSGTTNDFAHSHNIPMNPIEAAHYIVEGTKAPIDIGIFNASKHFSYVAAFGAFSAVSYKTPQQAKNVLGKAAYVLEGMRSLSDIKPIPTRFVYDGVRYEEDVILGIVSNSSSVAGIRLHLSDESMRDGLLEVTLFRNPKTLTDGGEIAATVLTGDLNLAQKAVFTFKTDKIAFDFAKPVAWTLDGEYGDTVSKASIAIAPMAISVIASQQKLVEG